MAKARPIPGLDGSDSMGLGAARIVRVRTDELDAHSRDVLDVADIERVHDMRVTTRRLRAALEVFAPCFPKKARRAALGEVKDLADALGERRDRDVAIASLEAFGADLPAPDRRGVHGLVELLRLEQARANEELRPYVKAERLASLCERLRELADAAERRAGRGPPLPSLTSFAGNGDGSR